MKLSDIVLDEGGDGPAPVEVIEDGNTGGGGEINLARPALLNVRASSPAEADQQGGKAIRLAG